MKLYPSILVVFSCVGGLGIAACSSDDPTEPGSAPDAGPEPEPQPQPQPEPQPQPQPQPQPDPDPVTDGGLDAADAAPDLENDPNNCGEVGKKCAAPRTCAKGECSRLVFATSAVYATTVAASASTVCTSLATAANLSGAYKAWVSLGSGADPIFAFTKSKAPYQLVDGTVVADDYAGLTSGTLKHGIDKDEKGDAAAGSAWTATEANGAFANAPNCTAFTSTANNISARVGSLGATDATWSNKSALTCNGSARFYCFEQ